MTDLAETIITNVIVITSYLTGGSVAVGTISFAFWLSAENASPLGRRNPIADLACKTTIGLILSALGLALFHALVLVPLAAQ